MKRIAWAIVALTMSACNDGRTDQSKNAIVCRLNGDAYAIQWGFEDRARLRRAPEADPSCVALRAALSREQAQPSNGGE